MAMSRKKKTIIISVAVVGLISIVVLSKAIQPNEGQPVQVTKVEKRAHIESKVTASGQVWPLRLYNLTAEVPGRVEQIYVTEGDSVKKGQPLVRVDPTQVSFQTQGSEASVRMAQADVMNQQVAVQSADNGVLQMKASLNSAEADLDRSKADLAYNEAEYKRNLQLAEDGIIARSFFEQVKSRYDQSKATYRAQESRVLQLRQQVRDAELGVERAKAVLNSSEARVRQTRSQLDAQYDQLKKTTRYAPIDGVVSSLPVKIGEYALASFSSTPLLTVADMSQINAEIKVDETDIADVALGQKAKVKVDALGDIEIDGEVVEKAASAITRSGQTISQSSSSQEAKDFLVKIKLNPAADVRSKLRPGMSATAVITTATADDVLAVPLQAIVPRELPGEKKEDQTASGVTKKKEVEGVFLMENNRAKFVPVQTGIKGDQEIELKSGLSEGQEIITGPYKTLRTLKDTDVVKREAKTEAPGSTQSK
jgi:HlyD family secretion protein